MELEIVFNELCLQTSSTDINTARQLMTDFINTILAIKTPSSCKKKLRTQSNFNNLQLAPNYLLVQWRNDQDVDIDARRLIRSLQDKNDPPLPDIADPEIQVTYQGQNTIGIYYAYVNNSLSISLQSEPQWDTSILEVEVIRINEDEEDPLIITNDIVKHASCITHGREHTDWLEEGFKINIENGNEIWDRKEELFPNLEFCDNVSKQLKNIQYRQLELAPVYKTLIELQKCCQNWKSGGFSVTGYPLDESGESEPTLNKYGQERLFTCPDNEERFFERHIKLRSCNWRIHFFPLQPGKVIIGYVGRHLPTVNYRT
ncbi:hypothetical protein VB638_21185 [Dolichospermum sp. UHCC 0684]|jgi:hypothetical protein|uniref:hypothetical protein n=1 Tax=unclassified Dolichospermum TaxID=2622029 RepID=UPI001445676D|nr:MULTISPECIES: hypothetical protein [unclassified Dolichospermum]MEA5532056.1 hypothetical protein [Dolichospermum sp. UHCC 0684]MTJ34422.1 hypothetical protein [Dolichospermum sp. UHCC 0260]